MCLARRNCLLHFSPRSAHHEQFGSKIKRKFDDSTCHADWQLSSKRIAATRLSAFMQTAERRWNRRLASAGYRASVLGRLIIS